MIRERKGSYDRCIEGRMTKTSKVFQTLFFAVLLSAALVSAGAQEHSIRVSLPVQTVAPVENRETLFDFHSGFWINLHHFLYRQALLSEPQKGPHPVTISGADNAELLRLSSSERTSWDAAVSYYKDSFGNRSLLFDRGMEAIKNQLEDAEESPDLANTQLSPKLKAVLLSVAPIYRKYWWPRHDEENRKWIAQLRPLVAQYGSMLAAEISTIYATPWPQYPVRIDAVAYADWAGAYTTLFPTRPTVSTSDPANQGTAALEIIFHETSHGMMGKLMDAIRLAETNLNAQRTSGAFHSGSIWHAVLFYMAGELVAKQVPGYVPYADKNGLWLRAWPGADHLLIEQDWKPHMQGSVGLQQALTKLIDDLAAEPSRKRGS